LLSPERRDGLPVLALDVLTALFGVGLARRNRRDIRLTTVGFSAGRLVLRWGQVERLTVFREPVSYTVSATGYMHWIDVWAVAGVELPPFTRLDRIQRKLGVSRRCCCLPIDGFPEGVQAVLAAIRRFHDVEATEQTAPVQAAGG
jgi:hypothetical protein